VLRQLPGDREVHESLLVNTIRLSIKPLRIVGAVLSSSCNLGTANQEYILLAKNRSL